MGVQYSEGPADMCLVDIYYKSFSRTRAIKHLTATFNHMIDMLPLINLKIYLTFLSIFLLRGALVPLVPGLRLLILLAPYINL